MTPRQAPGRGAEKVLGRRSRGVRRMAAHSAERAGGVAGRRDGAILNGAFTTTRPLGLAPPGTVANATSPR
jgi:hypothetical protein